jgi:signal transduction histidine kinase/CheY-like chemotaxis protein
MKHKLKSLKTGLLVSLLVLFLVGIPVVFTLYKEGRFTPKPTVSVVSAVTDADADTLTFAADYDFEPYSFYDESGNPSGLDIELATEIANRLGMKMKFVLGDWQQCKAMIQNGEADVLLGLEIFADTSKTTTLKTIPVTHDSIKIYSRKKILDVGSLYGKKVGISAGSIITKLFDLNCEFVGYNTNSEILKAVEDGEVDFGICHASVATKIIERDGLHLVPSLTLMESFPAMGIRESAPELEDPINLAIKSMADDGTINSLQNKWIAMNVDNQSFRTVLDNNLSFYVIYLIVAILILFGTFYSLTILRLRENKLEMALSYQKVLEDEKRKAEEANHAKSTFLLNMSHDIRTPMNAILGFSNIAEENIDDREKALDALKKARHSGEHLLQIINDILDMSRIESGKIELHDEVIDGKALFSRIEDLFRFSMEQKGLTFTVASDAHTRYFCGDSLRITQVISNLLGNAMKFTPAGGAVSCRVIETDTGEPGVAGFQIHITDTGVGMSKEFQKRMFEPFEREKTPTVSGVEGTGIGLSIAKRLAEKMGGSLTCESERGAGTKFVFRFLAKIADDPKRETAVANAEPRHFAGRRVLVVEDNLLNREIALNILKNVGFSTEEATNGREAVEKISHAEPNYYDLVLMDIQMPVMDGYEASRAIRALPDSGRRDLPIVAMTANAFEEDRKRALEAGMNEHIAKPIDIQQMLAVLENILRSSGKQ